MPFESGKVPSCAYPPFGICYACSPPRAEGGCFRCVDKKAAVVAIFIVSWCPYFVSPASAPRFLWTHLRLDAVGRVERVEDPTAHSDKCRPPLLCRRCRLYGRCAFCFLARSGIGVTCLVRRLRDNKPRLQLSASQLARQGAIKRMCVFLWCIV